VCTQLHFNVRKTSESGKGEKVLKYHYHNEHNQGLGVKTCSFKAQGVLGLSIFVLVSPYPAVPKVGAGKSASVGGFSRY
jgi:hypothetical protein